MQITPTASQVSEYAEHGRVTLTDEQIAQVRAMARSIEVLADLEERARGTYAPVLGEIQRYMPDRRTELYHTGGGIWLVQIMLEEMGTVDGDGIPTHPYLWISEDEGGAGPGSWYIGSYLHGHDEGVTLPARERVPTYRLSEEIANAIAAIHFYIEIHPEVRGESPIKEWFEDNANDLIHGHQPPPPGWMATVMVQTLGHAPLQAIEYHGARHFNDYWPVIVHLHNGEGEALYVLRWHDGVTGEWFEWFEDYDSALLYFARLFVAVAKEITVGEVNLVEVAAEVEGETEDLLAHYRDQHLGEEVDVRVWWDVPYAHSSRLELSADNERVLIVDTQSGKSGDTDGGNTYYCNLCDAELEPGELAVDYD